MPEKPQPAKRDNCCPRGVFWFLTTVTLLLVANWVAAVARFQVNVPMWDQWDYFNPLFEDEGWTALFRLQHGPHRQGLGFVLSSWVMAASGWDSRIESLWMVFLLTVSVVLALSLKKRVTGKLSAVDVSIPLLILTLEQWGSVIEVPNASHSVFPLMLILLAAHVWLDERTKVRLPVAALLAVCAIFTGFAIFAGMVLTVFLVMALVHALWTKARDEVIAAAIGVVIVAAGWWGFSVGYRFDPASDGYRFPHEPLFDYVRFLALMLAHPAGAETTTAAVYLIGGVLLIASVFIGAVTGWRWLRGKSARGDDVVLLLVGAGLAFAAFTAVGRIHLNIAAGMVSRYVTLLVPLWLGIYLWSVSRKWIPLRRAGVVAVLLMSLAPFANMLKRPTADWPGTAGLSDRARQALAESTAGKMAWVSAFLRTSDFREADRLIGRKIHPWGESNDLDGKLRWLRERRLSFFAQAESRAWQPWRDEPRSLWLHTATHDDDGCWMADESTLWIHNPASGWLNLRVVQKASGLPADAGIEFEHQQSKGRETAGYLTETISLPIGAGEQTLSMRSTTGAVPIHPPEDMRLLSYKFSHATLTPAPAGVVWTRANDIDAPWRAAYRWGIFTGFYGWEADTGLGWADGEVRLEVDSAQPLFLNVHIAARYRPVATGPLIVRVGDETWEVPFAEKSASFSLRLPGGASPHVIVLKNAGGAASPRDAEGKTDPRTLALRMRRLDVTEQPVFAELNADR